MKTKGKGKGAVMIRSAHKYEVAEQKLVEIMKEKGAVFSQPMLRSVLREEARKHIDDTGLVDHLLKYMGGKVAPGGTKRFRRWHNPVRGMVYWLENIRKDGSSHHAIGIMKLNLLQEKVATLKRNREMQHQLSKQEQEMKVAAASKRQQIYDNLLKRIDQLEVEFSNSLNEIKEQFAKLFFSSMEEEIARSHEDDEGKNEKRAKGMDSAADAEKRDADKEEGKASAEKRQRLHSGFRICMPHETFLSQSTMNSSSGSNIL